MPSVITDPELIDTFLERGVEQVYPSKEQLRQVLLSGQRIKAYQGFDPTGPYLHVGHAVGIRGLRILQKLGHEVTFLVGDFTARVGDPDKDTTRKILTRESVEHNMEGWKQQASQLIDFEGENPVQFKNNYEWLSQLKLENIIKLMSQTTVQQMLERDLFQKRIRSETPIGLQEFIYPLLQGYDSVAMQVDLEVGGSDQIFNMLVGRTLCKNMLGKEKYVRANVMMEAPDTSTMSKTKGNGINLSDTPDNIYGKAMSYSDEFIVKALTLLTDIPLQEIKQINDAIALGENPMSYKKLMAYETVKIIKGEKSAKEAQLYFESSIQQKNIDLDSARKTNLVGKMSLLDFVRQTTAVKVSSNEIKRIIQQGGAEINGEKITDPMKVHDFKKGDLIKLGKRNYISIA